MGSHIWTLAQNTLASLIMKFLVLAAAVAVSSAQLVTYPNGAQVPVDTPEVAAAKLAHAAAGGLVNPLVYAGYPYAAAYPYAVGVPGALVAHPNGAVVPADTAGVYAAKVAHAAAGGAIHPLGYYGLAYPAGLVAHANGAVVPVEPADVQAARAEHLAAHASA